MGQGTLLEVRDGSGGPRRSLGWVGDPLGGPGRVKGPYQSTRMGREALKFLGRVEGPSLRSGTGLDTLNKVRDVLGDPPGGPGHIGGHSQRSGMGGVPSRSSGTGQRTSPEVRDASGEPTGGPGLVGGPYRRSRTGRVLLLKVRD